MTIKNAVPTPPERHLRLVEAIGHAAIRAVHRRAPCLLDHLVRAAESTVV
jgi:hypothetical protein